MYTVPGAESRATWTSSTTSTRTIGDEAKRTFFTEGCGVLFGKAPCSRRSTFRGEASAVLYDMMPDDLDGVAAMLEDFDIE